MNPSEESVSCRVDIISERISKHKKAIVDYTMATARQYLEIIRPDNDKDLSMDAQAKDQLIYILITLIRIAERMDTDVPNDIPVWVENNITDDISDYSMYTYITSITHGYPYIMISTPIEETVLRIISETVEDEDLMQHVVETYLIFLKVFAKNLANFNWAATKRVSSVSVNGLLRNMSIRDVNPIIFSEMIDFALLAKKSRIG